MRSVDTLIAIALPQLLSGFTYNNFQKLNITSDSSLVHSETRVPFLTGTGNGVAFGSRCASWVPSDAGYTEDTTSALSVLKDWKEKYWNPVPVDLDGDGDFDVVLAKIYGTLVVYRNTGTALVKDDALLFGVDEDVDLPFPVFADFDGDGDLDLVISGQGDFLHYENTGSPTAPTWTLLFRSGWNAVVTEVDVGHSPFRGVKEASKTHHRIKSAFVDLDGDGDLDHVLAHNKGILYYENTGTSMSPAFQERMGSANPFRAMGISGAGGFACSFVDMDSDGDYDIIVSANGIFNAYRNSGTATSPKFDGSQFTGGENPFANLFNSDGGYKYQQAPQFMPSPALAPTASPTSAPLPTPSPTYKATPTHASSTAPVPASSQGGNEAAAKGDPHLRNIHGEHFDLMQPGKHVLLEIPRRSGAESLLLRVRADAQQMGPQCADMYFQQVNITGVWADQRKTGGLQFNAADRPIEEKSRWEHFGYIKLKVVRGRTQQGIHYLNLYMKHLSRLQFPIGGLLGEDDHSAAAARPKNCKQKTYLRLVRPSDVTPRSFAEADLS